MGQYHPHGRERRLDNRALNGADMDCKSRMIGRTLFTIHQGMGGPFQAFASALL